MKAGALLLTPGAGSDRDHPSLRAVEAALPIPVERHDFPYRREGRKVPDRAPKAIADLVEATARLARRVKVPPESIALGGRSFGGRMCSMAVAEGLPAAGLVLISYPLHPPGRPGNLRVEHFARIRVPCLFVSGTHDAFGSPEELERHAGAIEGPVTHVWVEGRGHDLKGADQAVVEAVVTWLGCVRGAGE